MFDSGKQATTFIVRILPIHYTNALVTTNSIEGSQEFISVAFPNERGIPVIEQDRDPLRSIDTSIPSYESMLRSGASSFV